VLFAWNPFVLMRVVGNGHNDLWMMLFVLAAFERMQRTRWTQAIALLALGVLLKFVPALLGPPFLLYIWTHAEGSRLRRLGHIALAGLASLALAVLCYAPFWVGLATFDNVRKESAHMTTSTPLLLQFVTTHWFAEPLATTLASWIPKAIFAGAYAAFVWQARRDFNRLVGISFAILFVYLVLAASWFRPWYMLWPIAIAALRPRTWLGSTLVAISVACAFPDLVEQFRSYWPLIAHYNRAIAAPIVVGFLPPLLVWLIGVGITDSFSLVRREVASRLD
jgi:alpha-1,6-mannosyltransferase